MPQRPCNPVHHGMTVFAFGVTLAASVAAPGTATAQPPQAAAMCTVSAAGARRIELSDGRIVSVDVQSVAVSGGTVMAVGRHAYVFPSDAFSRTSPTLQDSIIGVVIDASGRPSIVYRPLADRPVFHPRVAAGPNGSFHVLFATGVDTSSTAMMDTASLWYARFTNGTWSAPEHVAAVRGAALQPEHTSDLLERNGALTFLFPFAGDRIESLGGVILLRRRGEVWSADTLRTRLMPAAVRGLHAPPDESLVVLIAQSVPDTPSRAEELFLARFDSAWSPPRKIAGDGVRIVTLPVAAVLGGDVIVSWVSWQWMVPHTSVIEWLRIHPGGRVSAAAAIDSGQATFPFEMVVVDDRYPLWLYRGAQYGTTLAIAMATDSVAATSSSLTVPFHNPRARAVALSPTRLLVFTMKRAIINAEPMIASYTTVVDLRCPRSERR